MPFSSPFSLRLFFHDGIAAYAAAVFDILRQRQRYALMSYASHFRAERFTLLMSSSESNV